MKVIVTGSEGFIGKALCQRLEEREIEVVKVDRVLGIEAAGIGDILEEGGFDCVFHLAAQTSVFNWNLEQIKEDNIDTFMAVVKACNDYNVKLVYASSSTANPSNTTSMYGITKHFDELYASIYSKRATGIRFHNVYGPNPRKGTLLWYLMNKDKVQLYNNGENIRCFTYIDDIVTSILLSFMLDYKLVNAANPHPCSISDFAEEVKRYKNVDTERIAEKREFDNFTQSVDENIFCIPLDYISVEQGISKVFNG